MNLDTLIVGLAGILATLIASGLGLYFTAKARSAPLRETLYKEQLELIKKIIFKQGRIRNYAIILASDISEFKERAESDYRKCVSGFSELSDEAGAVLPTELYVEIKKLENFLCDFLAMYEDRPGECPEELDNLAGISTKVALVARAVMGVDELSQESLKLFSSGKNFKNLVDIELSELKPKNNKD